jgi:type VI secretion system protein ImpG
MHTAIAKALGVLERNGVHLDLERLPLDLEGKLGRQNLKLGCTPAVNLFPQPAEPIRCEGNLAEYRVVPDTRAPLAYEVQRIVAVEGIDAAGGAPREYRPFYALRHGDAAAEALAYWEARRRGSLRKGDEGSEVYLSLVDRGRRPRDSAGETLVVKTLCSNRDLPARLAMGDPAGDFSIEGRPGVGRIRTLQKPTPCWRLAPGGAEQWRLLSLLGLNHLSLLRPADEAAAADEDPDSGPTAFRELLRVLDFTDSATARQRVEGLVDLRARRVLRKIPVAGQRVFARGLAVTVELDESKFAGSGVFLFASVLERFFALYASINSFVELTARVRQREGVMKTWPPRAGEKPIL